MLALASGLTGTAQATTLLGTSVTGAGFDVSGTVGFTSSLVGDTLTLTVGPDCVLGPGCPWAKTSTASWSLTPGPLPAAAWLLPSALGGLLAGLAQRRARHAAAA